jgi:hypothetical protein
MKTIVFALLLALHQCEMLHAVSNEVRGPEMEFIAVEIQYSDVHKSQTSTPLRQNRSVDEQ